MDGPTPDDESNDFVQRIWSPRPLVRAGGFTRETAIAAAEEGNVLVAMGRYFISNVCLSSLFSSIWWFTVGI